MGAGIVKTLLAMMGVAVMAAIGSPLKYAVEPTWNCDNTTVLQNVTMRQVLGEWYLWDTYDSMDNSNYSIDVCVKITLTELLEEIVSHDKSFVKVTLHKPKIWEINFIGYFYKDKPEELFVKELKTVFRVQSLSADGGVLIIAGCNEGNYKFWMTLSDKEDSLPPDVPRPSSTIYRRNAKACLMLTSSD